MTTDVFDGFWLPRELRQRVLCDATWETLWLKGGALVTQDTPNAVAVRWPQLPPGQWRALLNELERARTVGGREAAVRWQNALGVTLARLLEQSASRLPTLSACTGYSSQMLAFALGQGELVNPASLAAALEFRPAWSAATRWEQMPGLPGWVRFFPQHARDRTLARFKTGRPLCRPAPAVGLALGYAAGNVPGTALVMALLGSLANYAAGAGTLAPAVLVRNSRHEPLFAPWVLSVIETTDPALVAGLGVLIWDYDDEAWQGELMRRAGLMIAAAGDETISALEALRARFAPTLRFHRHGHKASFAVIGKETTESSQRSVVRPQPSANGRQPPAVGGSRSEIARLAALDSSLWDQNGCLSARVHFVEGDADEYAQALTAQMRALGLELPRGTTPQRLTHRAFDYYAARQEEGRVRVCSTYDDDWAVIVDARVWDGEAMRRAVNACQGRVIVVRSVKDILDVPTLLRWLPAANLQSVSVAIGGARVLEFAEAAGVCGVTAVRGLGRAAFPQLAYSWDGYLPLDVGYLRPAGHFTTVESVTFGGD